MLTKRIIPCLDVKEGRVVKGTHFLGLKDAGDPVEAARLYDREGADELVFLDITASLEGRKTLRALVERVAVQVSIPLTVGGGVSSVEDIALLLSSGADKVAMNTAAFLHPHLVKSAAAAFGSQCVVVAIDARRSGGSFEVVIRSGRQPTGTDVLSWAERAESLGAGEILLTSIDRDGTGLGFDLELTSLVSGAVSIPVIASGGGAKRVHFYQALTSGQADAALAASTFHYRRLPLPALKEYLHKRGVAVRWP